MMTLGEWRPKKNKALVAEARKAWHEAHAAKGGRLWMKPPPSTSPLPPPTLPPHVPPSSSARGRGTYSGRLSPGPYRRARFARAMHGGLAL